MSNKEQLSLRASGSSWVSFSKRTFAFTTSRKALPSAKSLKTKLKASENSISVMILPQSKASSNFWFLQKPFKIKESLWRSLVLTSFAMSLNTKFSTRNLFQTLQWLLIRNKKKIWWVVSKSDIAEAYPKASKHCLQAFSPLFYQHSSPSQQVSHWIQLKTWVSSTLRMASSSNSLLCSKCSSNKMRYNELWCRGLKTLFYSFSSNSWWWEFHLCFLDLEEVLEWCLPLLQCNLLPGLI